MLFQSFLLTRIFFRRKSFNYNKSICAANGLIDQQELCTAHYKVYMLYEYIQYTLEREIKDRVIRSQRFSTEELYRLISESVAVLAYLQNVGIQHLHLRPSTFFITEYYKFYDYKISLSVFMKNLQFIFFLKKRKIFFIYFSS